MFVKNLAILTACLGFMSVAVAQRYTAPPISSTTGYVPVISDQQMEQCVEIYNQAKWLDEELSRTSVNQYSSYEVNAYNQKANKHRQLTSWFNQNCAGKQSQSACKAAQELNRKNGLPTQSCY